MEYKNSDMFRAIDEYVHVSVDRKILKDRYLNGLTVEQLAEKYYTSTSSIKRTVDKYQGTLTAALA